MEIARRNIATINVSVCARSCCMMLLQKGAAINIQVNIPAPKPVERAADYKPAWHFPPTDIHSAPGGENRKVKARSYPFFQTVIYNQWQGLTFMVLDNMALEGQAFALAVEAALTVNKYNLALTFLRKQRHDYELQTINKDGRNLWHVLVMTADRQEDMQLRIAEVLRDRGVDPMVTDNYGANALICAGYQQAATLGKFLLGK